MRRKWKEITGYSFVFVFCFALSFSGIYKEESTLVNGSNVASPKLAIVIDDLGYGAEGTREMLELPIDFTVAIMPFSEHAKQEGEDAQTIGKEVIVHMPMESLTGKKSWVGDTGIFLHMNPQEIVSTTQEAFDILPMAIGLNNHMGSAIMESETSLKPVLEELKSRGLFFLDSVTTPNSVGEKISDELEIPFLKREVFLDSTKDVNKIKENLLQAAKIAKENGSAIAIGHVGIEGGFATVKAIQEMMAPIQEMGVEFVFISELLE